MKKGIAVINGYDGYDRIAGTVSFRQLQCGVLVTAHIFNLPDDGFFAFHIHQGERCEEPMGHFLFQEEIHPNHAGDLPPLLSASGKAYLSVLTNRFTLNDVIGKAVIIHRNPDDFRTQPAGDSGERIACGIIGLH